MYKLSYPICSHFQLHNNNILWIPIFDYLRLFYHISGLGYLEILKNHHFLLAQQKQGLNLWPMFNFYCGSNNCALNHFLNWLKSFSFINIPWLISKIKLFSESLEPIKLWLLQMREFLWETRLVEISSKDCTWWLEFLEMLKIATALRIFMLSKLLQLMSW